MEERGGVSRAHYHVKRYAPKLIAVNRAVFDKVKRVFKFEGHLMSSLKHSHHKSTYLRKF